MIEPVWISSEKHLAEFSEIHKRTSLWKKFCGLYEFPKDFPLVKLYYFIKIPIVYFSKGFIKDTGESFFYSAKKSDIGFLKSYSGLKNELSFELKYEGIKSAEWYEPSYSQIKYYGIKWIRIICQEDILDGDFLICVGGNGPSMERIIKNTRKLYDLLIEKIK